MESLVPSDPRIEVGRSSLYILNRWIIRLFLLCFSTRAIWRMLGLANVQLIALGAEYTRLPTRRAIKHVKHLWMLRQITL